MEYLTIRILGRIPKGYKSGMVLDEEAIGLTECWEGPGEDEYHVRLMSRSRYASMDDIKEHILSLHPEYDMSCWSMCSGGYHGSCEAHGNGWDIRISEDELKGLRREHVSEGIYENVIKEWSIEIPYEEREAMEAMEGVFPCYVDRKSLRAYSGAMMDFYKGKGKDWVDGFMEDLGCPHSRPVCLAALQAAYAYASQRRKKCIARIAE